MQQARMLAFAGLTSAADAPKRLVAKVGASPFRAALGAWTETGGNVLVDADTATRLGLQTGDLLLGLPLTSPRQHETPR
jgi:hypothetical protein